MKSLLFFPKRESFINYVGSPNTFFFTNVTSNYTFWNINLSIQSHKDWSNSFLNLSNHCEKQSDWLFGGSRGRYFRNALSEQRTAMGWTEDQLVHMEQLGGTQTVYNWAKLQNIVVAGGKWKEISTDWKSTFTEAAQMMRFIQWIRCRWLERGEESLGEVVQILWMCTEYFKNSEIKQFLESSRKLNTLNGIYFGNWSQIVGKKKRERDRHSGGSH